MFRPRFECSVLGAWDSELRGIVASFRILSLPLFQLSLRVKCTFSSMSCWSRVSLVVSLISDIAYVSSTTSQFLGRIILSILMWIWAFHNLLCIETSLHTLELLNSLCQVWTKQCRLVQALWYSQIVSPRGDAFSRQFLLPCFPP